MIFIKNNFAKKRFDSLWGSLNIAAASLHRELLG
jgi:hypothetical protein